MGAVGTTKSLPSDHLSCEFLDTAGTGVVIVNLGPSSAASFATLRTASAGGGRTITSVPGFGAEAFAVSMGGATRGFAVLTTGGVVYSVETVFPLAKDESLVQALEALS
jgi:hypothetical protein